ncbi:alpha-1,4-glucan synthase Ags1 [Pseudozyma hubeiensis SY62]|uniref:Alpha-1,4-glucan synthase Ags1 n=1 Tax=Pseudozyma hubeiensis (strain SY62) TaxID=1305764 RepID=R9PIF9_PSEHS|nr:alpha-1,4-glucan synthase Ags1 [Pseudozyma hubeiensis SY62]GAC97860.1 alpha-1,4-glucan synthase Ags1 [Pseudozyma hubeiensis SY62]
MSVALLRNASNGGRAAVEGWRGAIWARQGGSVQTREWKRRGGKERAYRMTTMKLEVATARDGVDDSQERRRETRLDWTWIAFFASDVFPVDDVTVLIRPNNHLARMKRGTRCNHSSVPAALNIRIPCSNFRCDKCFCLG